MRVTQRIEQIVDFAADNKISFRLEFPSPNTYMVTLYHESLDECIEVYDARDDNVLTWDIVRKGIGSSESTISDFYEFLKSVGDWATDLVEFDKIYLREMTVDEFCNYIKTFIKSGKEVKITNVDNRVSISVGEDLDLKFKLK